MPRSDVRVACAELALNLCVHLKRDLDVLVALMRMQERIAAQGRGLRGVPHHHEVGLRLKNRSLQTCERIAASEAWLLTYAKMRKCDDRLVR